MPQVMEVEIVDPFVPDNFRAALRALIILLDFGFSPLVIAFGTLFDLRFLQGRPERPDRLFRSAGHRMTYYQIARALHVPLAELVGVPAKNGQENGSSHFLLIIFQCQ